MSAATDSAREHRRAFSAEGACLTWLLGYRHLPAVYTRQRSFFWHFRAFARLLAMRARVIAGKVPLTGPRWLPYLTAER
jgi:hypothetical protein